MEGLILCLLYSVSKSFVGRCLMGSSLSRILFFLCLLGVVDWWVGMGVES